MKRKNNVVNLFLWCILFVFTLTNANAQGKIIQEKILLDLSDVDKREVHSIKYLKSNQVFTYEKYSDKEVININIDIEGHGHLYFILVDQVAKPDIQDGFMEFSTLNRFLYYFDSLFVRQNYEQVHFFSSRFYLTSYDFENLYVQIFNDKTNAMEYYKTDFVYTVSTQCGR